MMESTPTMADAFYAGVAEFDGFNRTVGPAAYKPLPDGWMLGLADIAGSTGMIAAGGHKSVNMAGASVVTAVANAVGTPEFPFVFGGDHRLCARLACPIASRNGACLDRSSAGARRADRPLRAVTERDLRDVFQIGVGGKGDKALCLPRPGLVPTSATFHEGSRECPRRRRAAR
jgi:Protein of unknown function (DUF3095)